MKAYSFTKSKYIDPLHIYKYEITGMKETWNLFFLQMFILFQHKNIIYGIKMYWVFSFSNSD